MAQLARRGFMAGTLSNCSWEMFRLSGVEYTVGYSCCSTGFTSAHPDCTIISLATDARATTPPRTLTACSCVQAVLEPAGQPCSERIKGKSVALKYTYIHIHVAQKTECKCTRPTGIDNVDKSDHEPVFIETVQAIQNVFCHATGLATDNDCPQPP